MADADPLQAEEKIVEASMATHADEIALDQPFPDEITAPTAHLSDVPVADVAAGDANSPAPAAVVEAAHQSLIRKMFSIFHKQSKTPKEVVAKEGNTEAVATETISE